MIKYQRALFVHTPKTGGIWVEQVLQQHGGSKFSYSHQIVENKLLAITLRRLKPFCFVRHPIDFVYSIWKHWAGNPQCRINNQDSTKFFMWDKRHLAQFYCSVIDENDVNKTLVNFTNEWPGFVTWLYERFANHCFYVGKYENLRHDLVHALRLINGQVDKSLLDSIAYAPPQNVSVPSTQLISQNAAKNFIEHESCISRYGYKYLPNCVSAEE